jgi:SPP1 gp7 family putative phage head morphogenesis protein
MPSIYRPPLSKIPTAPWFHKSLKNLSEKIGKLTKQFFPGGLVETDEPYHKAMQEYSELLTPWATKLSSRLIQTVERRNALEWQRHTENLSSLVKKEIATTPIGEVVQKLLNEQVSLIKSMPIEAAERVHKLSLEMAATGGRAVSIEEMVQATGQVTASRAKMIARTEIARVNSVLSQARSMHIGSIGYIWRTVEDSHVRPMHNALDGTYHRWDDPPECDKGIFAHPGQVFNCRCFAEPVLPDIDVKEDK